MADLKSALARAVVWGYLATNPLAKVTPLKVDKSAEVRYLSPDEHKRLVAALAQRDERIKAERERANAWRRSRGYLEMQELRPYRFADHFEAMLTVPVNPDLRAGFSIKRRVVMHRLKSATTAGS